MIGIKVNGIFWDMLPGSTAEIERKSPFFFINAIERGEFSTTITFKYSSVNDQGAAFYFQYYTERVSKSIQVEYYDGPMFKSQATLVLESASLNINRVEESEITGFLLFSLSNFYQLVKDEKGNDKKLKVLKLGGIRSFDFTTNNPTDGSAGYWQHFHDTWTDDTIPYVFTPIRNEAIIFEKGDAGTDDAPEWMNKLDNNGKLAYDFSSPLVPIIRLKYLLTQAFAEHGFKVDFSGLNDIVWEKMLLVNLVKVDWVNITPVAGDPPVAFTPAPKLKIDLRKHVPQDKSIFDFIIQFCLKYGWAPLFSLQKRECRFVAFKELGKGVRKDWTPYANPKLTTTFNQQPKIWAFKNEIDSNDEYPTAPDFTGIKFYPPHLSIHYATPPTQAMEGRVTFSYDDNTWYQVKLDKDSNEYEWKPFADNIFDYEPEGATDTISSTISTLPIVFSEYRTNESDQKRYCYFPIMKQNTTKAIGYRTLIYHGLNYELNSDRAAGELLIPYSSSIREQSFGAEPLAWSNVYKNALFMGSVAEEEYGIIAYWFQHYLDTLVRGEEPVFRLELPLLELLNFSWDDEIIIHQVPYMVMQITEPSPYKGFVQATMKRVVKKLIITTNNIRPVYVQLTQFNVNPTSFEIPFAGTVHVLLCDIKINLYSDAAGTIAYTPVTPINIAVRSKRTDDGVLVLNQAEFYTIGSDEEVIMDDTPLTMNVPVDHESVFEYSIDSSTNGEYLVI